METKYLIRNVNTGEKLILSLPEILEEINRDRSDQWQNYDESDWQEGLEYFTEYEILHQIAPDKSICTESHQTGSKDSLIEKVIEQIKKDLASEDLTAIYELLDNIGITQLIAFLPEEREGGGG